MPRALYPGRFDPVTRGHLDIVERCCAIFDTLEIAVADVAPESARFTVKERVRFLQAAVTPLDGAEVHQFSGLLVDHVQTRPVDVVVRGLRQSSDFEYEYRMAAANRQMLAEMETIFIPTSPEYSHISATLVREVYDHGGDLTPFVPERVIALIDDLGERSS